MELESNSTKVNLFDDFNFRTSEALLIAILRFETLSYYQSKNETKTVEDIYIRHHDGSSGAFDHKKDMNKSTLMFSHTCIQTYWSELVYDHDENAPYASH